MLALSWVYMYLYTCSVNEKFIKRERPNKLLGEYHISITRGQYQYLRDWGCYCWQIFPGDVPTTMHTVTQELHSESVYIDERTGVEEKHEVGRWLH